MSETTFILKRDHELTKRSRYASLCQMVNPEVSKHMAAIGTEGGKNYKPGSDRMRQLAILSWTHEARAKRLRSKTNAKQTKPAKINNNKSVA